MNVAIALAIGVLGSTHCVGMCGGLVAASRVRGRKVLPQISSAWSLGLAQNAGRVGSYGVLGALAGGLGGQIEGSWQGRLALQALALVVLLLSAGGLLGWLPARFSVERLGSGLWQRLAPRARSLLPLRSTRDALLFGALWGFLPCGIVYSALALASATGSALHGALSMCAFGLGTTPALLLVGQLAHRLASWARFPRIAGLAVLGFAALQVVTLVRTGRDPHVCCTSSAAAAWVRADR